MKYEHKRTNRLAEVVNKTDDKVTIHFIEENTDQTMTLSTFKRWWKKVDEAETETTESVEPVTEEVEKEVEAPVVDAEKELTDEQYAQIGKEIAQDAKKKADAVKKEKKSTSKTVKPTTDVKALLAKRKEELLKVLDAMKDSGVSYKLYERIPNLILVRYNEKSVLEIRISKLGATFNCKENVCPKGLEYTTQNYYLPATIKTSEYPEMLNTLITAIKNQ